MSKKRVLLSMLGLVVLLIVPININIAQSSGIHIMVRTIIEDNTLFGGVGEIWIVAGDITNDGKLDLVLTKGRRAGAAVLQDVGGMWDGGTMLAGPSRTVALRPMIAPIRNDGSNWLVYSEHEGGNIYEWLRGHRYSGTILVENKDVEERLGFAGWFAPAAADLDGNSDVEVWFVSLYNEFHQLHRYVWDPTSQTYSGVKIKSGSGPFFDWLRRPTVADFYGNGTDNLIWLPEMGQLDLVTYTPGFGTHDHTSSPIFNISSRISAFDTGQYDGKQGDDIAVTTVDAFSTSSLYLVSGVTAQVNQLASSISEKIWKLRVADLDGNGLVEIYFLGEYGGVYGYDDDQGLRLLANYPDCDWSHGDGVVIPSSIENREEVLFVCPVYNNGFRVVNITGIPINSPPVANANGQYITTEGTSISLDASGSSDPDDNIDLYEWDLDNDGEFNDAGGVAPQVLFNDDYSSSINLKVTDEYGEFDTDTSQLTVLNVAPSVGEITAPVVPVEVGILVEVTASFVDPGVEDTHTAIWDWGDDASSTGIVEGLDVSGYYTYDTPGVYTITLTVTDDDGGLGIADYRYVVVYDPSGGFVTGGGWINSPEGAYAADPLLSGKATFGFVSKYKKGANIPSGQTQFQFKVADLNFHSDTYQWLVIAGAKAKFKGIGSINGVDGYGFMLTAIDGVINGGGGVDKFRIKIWKTATDEIVYDNQIGAEDDTDPVTGLGGGSIVIHKPK